MASFEAVNASYEADAATLRAAEAVYDRLVASHPLTVGKLLSASERDAKGLAASTLVYGEILFEPFAATLLKMKRQFGALHAPGGVFVDVGSGTGKPVFAACLLHAWAAARGVEVLDGLHRASLELLDAWQSPAVQSALPVGMGATDISFVRGDATLGGLAGGGLGLAAADAAAAAAARERAAGGGGGGGGAGGGGAGGGGGGAGGGGARDPADWSDADVVFMNSTCFSEPLMLALAAVAERMRAGSWAITLTRRLPSVRWRVVDQTVYSMSWGVATVFIHVKTG